jgi:transposase InsO family protein
MKQTYRAKDIAEVIFDRVYKHHGMPVNIVSDHDSLFTSTFWKQLHELTGTELKMSSSYHPQSNGLTEKANWTMTQMVHQCVSADQRDWASKLLTIEFAMNSACSQTMGYPPFMLNNSHMPQPMIWHNNTEYPGICKFAQQMKDAILTAHDAILSTCVKRTHLTNNHCKEAPFVTGDLVYLSTANLTLPKGQARKLALKFIGLYKILDEYKNNTFWLDLPAELKQRGLHLSFHVNLLWVHVPNDDRQFPGWQLN